MEVTVDRKAPSSFERRVVGRMVRTFFRYERPPRTTRVITHLPWQPVAFEGNNGARIEGRWFPARNARGTVVLAHPDRRSGQQWFLPHGYVEFLLDASYNVLTFDFAGYGGSRGGSTYLFEDVVAACNWAQRRAGDPVHLWGVSLGAFSAANAAPHLPFLGALILESPFPSFNSWYRGMGRVTMNVFDVLFRRTSSLIQADENLRRTQARRVLVAASQDDRVTPFELSQRVAAAAPKERSECLFVRGPDHLRLFESSRDYRDAVLRTLEAARTPHFSVSTSMPWLASPAKR